MALLENYVAEPPPLYETEQGAVRVRGTRVSLDTVIHAHNGGAAPEEIVRSYTTLTVRDVYAVITYYLDRRDAVDAYIARREDEANKARQQFEALYPLSQSLQEKLAARKAEQEQQR